MQSQDKKGSIFLLMGYLGSGKTTFIKNVLNNNENTKYAVIQNEFAEGQMGIQQPLIVDETGVPFSSFLQLPNGCICCSAKNDLVAGIQYILNNTDVKNIIVQTNGLADPVQSIKQFWFDEKMNINAQLHSIVGIFSVRKFQSLKTQALYQKQIVFANKALITFIDKSTEDEVKELIQYIREANPQCEIVKNTQLEVIKFISGDKIFSTEKLQQQFKQVTLHHHKGINSIFLQGTALVLSKNEFQCCIGQLLWESGTKVMRIKANMLTNYKGILEIYLRVDDTFQIKQTKTKVSKFQGMSKILVIGENLQKQSLLKIIKLKI